MNKLATVLLAGAVLLAAPPAQAEIERGTYEVELWVGHVEPGPEFVDSGLSFGFRFGYAISRHVGGYFQLAIFHTDAETGLHNLFRPEIESAKLETSQFDLVVDYHVNPHARNVVALFGGVGRASITPDDVIDGSYFAVNHEPFTDDSLTINAGASVKLQLSERVYIRPAVQTRWFEARPEDRFDAELLFGVGFLLN